MCGIAGIVKRNVIRDKNIINSMVESIKHRGPDGMGVYLFNNCALGDTKLTNVDSLYYYDCILCIIIVGYN